MKKIISMLLMSMILFSANAQVSGRPTQMPLVYGDTVITTATLDTVYKTIPVTAGYSALGIQVNAVKVSGTITAKAYLYGSLDGVTYVVTDSSTAFANVAGSQSAWFTKTAGLPYGYYQVQVRNIGQTGSTESLAIRVWYILRKFDR